MNQLKEQLVEQLFKANQPGQIPVVDPKKENSSKNESPSIPLLPILETKQEQPQPVEIQDPKNVVEEKKEQPKVSEPTTTSTNSSSPKVTISTKERYDIGQNMIVNFAFESSKTDAYDWIGLYSSTEKKK